MRVNGVVDRLVREVQFGLLGPYALECSRDLLQRPIPAQHLRHQRPQQAISIELGGRMRCPAPPCALVAPPSSHILRASGCATLGSGSPRCVPAPSLCSADFAPAPAASAASPVLQAATAGIFSSFSHRTSWAGCCISDLRPLSSSKDGGGMMFQSSGTSNARGALTGSGGAPRHCPVD